MTCTVFHEADTDMEGAVEVHVEGVTGTVASRVAELDHWTATVEEIT